MISFRLTPPRSRMRSAPSTIWRVFDYDIAPTYMPANCGCPSSMRHFSMSVVTKGQPNASIAYSACFCKPSRAILKAGNATMDFAFLIRAAMAAIAFCNASVFDRAMTGFTSAVTTGERA